MISSSTCVLLVYVSLGTLHRGSLDFFRCCFAAFGGMPAQVVLAVGSGTDVAALGNAAAEFRGPADSAAVNAPDM